jgi:ABC-type Mn2+/Zn2+ transport system ATPase subunit
MSASLEESELCEILSKVLLTAEDESKQVMDSDLIAYLAGMLADSDEVQVPLIAAVPDENVTQGAVYQSIGPFLESSGCEPDQILRACAAVHQLARTKCGVTAGAGPTLSSIHADDAVKKLRQGLVTMSSTLSAQSDASVDSNRFLWGADKGVAAFINVTKEAHSETTSAKDKRKQRQELERARKEFEAKAKAMEEEEKADGHSIVTPMVLPDYRSGRNERDILVRNVGLSLDNGRILLDHAELRFAYRRRYGLVGKNGVGKTCLLKAMASLEIPDFPKHHRILHVRQEVRAAGHELTVLQAVLQSDVERTSLLAEEKDIISRMEGGNIGLSFSSDLTKSRTKIEELLQQSTEQSNSSRFEQDLKRLNEVYARLAILSSDTAEARAVQILSGLQFTTSMQNYQLSALSGGWRHRVQIAAALFIEPGSFLHAPSIFVSPWALSQFITHSSIHRRSHAG